MAGHEGTRCVAAALRAALPAARCRRAGFEGRAWLPAAACASRSCCGRFEHPETVTAQLVITCILAAAGAASAALAIRCERHMQRHRQPGVGYAAVTFRRDGGWRRADLFTPEGLRYQRQASRFGVTAAALWLLSLVAWAALAA